MEIGKREFTSSKFMIDRRIRRLEISVLYNTVLLWVFSKSSPVFFLLKRGSLDFIFFLFFFFFFFNEEGQFSVFIFLFFFGFKIEFLDHDSSKISIVFLRSEDQISYLLLLFFFSVIIFHLFQFKFYTFSH